MPTKKSVSKAAASPAKTSAKDKEIASQPSALKARGEKKKKAGRRKKSVESFKMYLYKVLKQVHPDIGISSKAMGIMNSLVFFIFLPRCTLALSKFVCP